MRIPIDDFNKDLTQSAEIAKKIVAIFQNEELSDFVAEMAMIRILSAMAIMKATTPDQIRATIERFHDLLIGCAQEMMTQSQANLN